MNTAHKLAGIGRLLQPQVAILLLLAAALVVMVTMVVAVALLVVVAEQEATNTLHLKHLRKGLHTP